MTVNFNGLTFNVIDDLRNDLIFYYVYDKKYVANLSDDEVLNLIDIERRKEEALLYKDDDDYVSLLPISCSNCNSKNMQNIGEMDDFTLLECPKCQNTSRVHYTTINCY